MQKMEFLKNLEAFLKLLCDLNKYLGLQKLEAQEFFNFLTYISIYDLKIN